MTIISLSQKLQDLYASVSSWLKEGFHGFFGSFCPHSFTCKDLIDTIREFPQICNNIVLDSQFTWLDFFFFLLTQMPKASVWTDFPSHLHYKSLFCVPQHKPFWVWMFRFLFCTLEIFMTWELGVVRYCSKNRMPVEWQNRRGPPREQKEDIHMAESTLAATESNIWNGILRLELAIVHVTWCKLNGSLFKGQKLVLSAGEWRLEVQSTLMYRRYDASTSTSHLWDCLLGAHFGNMHILCQEVTDWRGVAEVAYHSASLPYLLHHARVRRAQSVWAQLEIAFGNESYWDSMIGCSSLGSARPYLWLKSGKGHSGLNWGLLG